MEKIFAEILEVSHYNDTLPTLGSDLVERDSYLNTIEQKLKTNDIVFINGEEGVGKTTVLVNFVMKNPYNSISYFISANDKYTFTSPCFKLNLANQIWYYSTGNIIDDQIDTDDLLSNLQKPLRNKIRNEDKFLYFIFDGFEDISKQDMDSLKNIIDILPKNAKFILTGTEETWDFLISKKTKTSNIDIISFHFTETQNYFKELKANEEELREIHKIAHNGLPLRVNQLKRFCLDAGSVKKFLLEDTISEKTNLFDLEWKQVKEKDEIILAFIAFNDQIFNTNDICSILKIDNNSLQAQLSEIDFIDISETTVNFISSAHKIFAKNKLQKLEEKIGSIIIDYYETNKSSKDSIFNLPSHYQKAKKWKDLTKLLSIDAFIQYVEKFETISCVKRQFDYGIKACKEIKKPENYIGDYLRFALHKSSFLELEKYEMWESEVEARITLEEYDKAFILANSVLLKEDRLKLLAVIAKQRKLLELEADSQLMEQIKELYSQIDFSEIKDKGFEIATLLIYSDFETAISLMGKINENSSDINSVDYAFAYLTFFAKDANRKSKTNLVDIDLLNSKIKDKEFINLSAAFDSLSDDYSSDDILICADKLNNTSQKVFLLRYWISHNKEKINIEKVIEYSINVIISSSNENIPNATSFADIASPLPFIKNFEQVNKIVKLLDSQKDTIKTPTRDFVKLQLTIAEALNNFCIETSKIRFYEIWFFIEEEVNDLSTKTDCLTLIWKKFIKIDKDNTIERSIYNDGKIEKQITNNLNKLLKETAYHYRMVEYIITTIVTVKPVFVFEIIKKLNIQERRNVALRLAAINYIDEIDIAAIDFSIVRKFINELNDQALQKDIIIKLIDKLVVLKEKAIRFIPELVNYKINIFNIDSSIDKCYALTNSLKVFGFDKNNYDAQINEFYEKLIKTWEVIDVQWRKIEVGFLITKDLVDFSKEKAKEFLLRTTNLKESEPLSSNSIVNTYILSTKLCIRAFNGISFKEQSLEKEYIQLNEIIEQIQSNGEKIKLWNIVALNFKANHKEDEFQKILKEKIDPLLFDLNPEDKYYKISVISKIAPSLFYYSQSYFFSIIRDFPENAKNKTLNNICNYIFTKVPYDEPIEENTIGYELTNSEYLEICTVLEHLTDDFLFYQVIDKIALNLKMNRGRCITEEQRNNIILKLDEIVNSKLPNIKCGITHKGYWILSKAALLTIYSYNTKKNDWVKLINDAKIIPNTSDQALVLSQIAEMIPSSKNLKIELMEDAFKLIKNIPSNYDKTNRLDATWEIWFEIDKSKFYQYLKSAYTELINNHDGTLNNFKNIIDIAHQHDKALAESFITLLDQDPARRNLKDSLQKRLNTRKKIDVASKNFDKISELSPTEYKEVFTKNLSQLNSGRSVSKKIEETLDIIETTSNTRLSIAYKSVAYFIQNAITKNYPDDINLTQSIFEATYQNAKLVATFSADNIHKMKTLFKYTSLDTSTVKTIFRSGEKKKFNNFLKDWMNKFIRNEIILIDPYFTEEELYILKIVLEVKNESSIIILGSKKGKIKNELELEEKFHKHWNTISADNPPNNRIIIVWDEKTNECPFHDRWLVSDNLENGLHINSINGLGAKRDTQIIEMNKEELQNLRDTVITDYIYMKKRKSNGLSLKYYEFELKTSENEIMNK